MEGKGEGGRGRGEGGGGRDRVGGLVDAWVWMEGKREGGREGYAGVPFSVLGG